MAKEIGTFREDLKTHSYATDENTLVCHFVSGKNADYSWEDQATMIVTFDLTKVGVHVEPGNHEHNKIVAYGLTQGYKVPCLQHRENENETEFKIKCQPTDSCAFWQPEGESTKGSQNVNKAEDVAAVDAMIAAAEAKAAAFLKRAKARKAELQAASK